MSRLLIMSCACDERSTRRSPSLAAKRRRPGRRGGGEAKRPSRMAFQGVETDHQRTDRKLTDLLKVLNRGGAYLEAPTTHPVNTFSRLVDGVPPSRFFLAEQASSCPLAGEAGFRVKEAWTGETPESPVEKMRRRHRPVDGPQARGQ